jgi:hypothetical protein
MNNEQLNPESVRLNEVEPEGFCAPGKSLINEVEKLREAVLLLCDQQKELAANLDAALSPINGKAA